MRSRSWGLIFLVALIVAAILLSAALIWQRGSEANPATPKGVEEASLPASTALPVVPTQARPVTYTVQSGDTLSAIAQVHDVSIEALTAANDLLDPDFLQIGQVLIIPQEEPTEPEGLATTETLIGTSTAAEPANPPLPTLTPSGPPLVEIREVVNVGNLETEAIVLENKGGAVSLDSWTLSSGAADAFVLPALTLFTDGKVRVHSADGAATPRDLYWGRTEPAWREGELATLRDAEGNVVDTHIVPES